MEVSRLRLLFLIALAATTLPGCALFRRGEPEAPAATVPAGEPVTGEPSDKPIIDPQVERREIRRTRIDTEDFEVGAYVGVLSIEDFESNVVYGARLAYHLTEDFFLEATAGPVARRAHQLREPVGLGGPADRQRARLHVLRVVGGLERAAGRDLSRQEPRVQHGVLPGRGHRQHDFAGDDRFTVSGGFGYRILPADWIAVHFDVRDHVYDIDLLGEKKIVNNLEAHLGLSIFF